MKKSFLVSLMIVLIVGLILGGCAKTTPTTTPATTPTQTLTPTPAQPVVSEWNIPVLTITTGPLAFWGLTAQLGAELATEEVNAAGGVRGVPIKITVYDTGMDPSKAVAIMTQAFGEKPLVVLGPMSGTECVAVGPLAAEERVTVLAGGGYQKDLRQFAPWVTMPVMDFTASHEPALTEWLRRNPDIKSVVQFYFPEEPGSVMSKDAASETFKKAGIKEFAPIETPMTTVDFEPLVVRALDNNPDGIFLVVMPNQAPEIIIQLIQHGFEGGRRIIGNPGVDTGTLFQMAEGYLEDVYLWFDYNLFSERPQWQAAVAANQQQFDLPEGFYPASPFYPYYDMILLVAAAFEACNITGDPAKLEEERIAICDYVRNVRGFQGLTDTFDIVNGEVNKASYLIQVKDNKQVLVTKLEW